MSLGKSERAVIYGSDSLYVQVERWLLNRPDKMATINEMREFFFDISAGAFFSVLSVLSARKVLKVDGDNVSISIDAIIQNRGERSDALWRAVRILKVFTAREIQKLLPDYSKPTIYCILDGFIKAGAVIRDGKTAKNESIYRLIKDSKVRPIFTEKSNKQYDKKVDVIWSIIKGFKDDIWTTNSIKSDKRWAESGATSKYLEELLRQWRGEGIIEEVNPDTRSRREARRYRTLAKERIIVLTHYGRKNG